MTRTALSAASDPTRAPAPARNGPTVPQPAPLPRPTVRGPFLFAGEDKLTVKGVTYGTFAADGNGDLFPPRSTVRADFARMRACHINTVRTYTPPPDWLLEEARAAGLRVMVGIYWDVQTCSFDDPAALLAAERTVRDTVRRCRAYADVVLAWVIGNEVPALIARLHGRRVIERFLERLAEAARREDPQGLVTYGNYPSTEFLQLDFLDFLTLNVYLLERQALSAYLDRMLIEAKGKPLVLGEIGDDSLRRGEAWQADLLDWTVPLVLDKGVAGLCVFGWTDDWVVGGKPIENWTFGLVDRWRKAKRALDVVTQRFGQHWSQATDRRWPCMSVVVCNYNGGETLDETLRSLMQLDYPDYEVVYVDDGSTDDSLAIARRYADRIRIIAQENRGLSAARNVGAQAATGDIVVYVDSDAFADPEWLRFLAVRFASGEFAAVGGPNLTPASDGLTAQCIALCPGNPAVVLKDNVHADHVAGVNMAFRRDVLLSIGGFDPVHRKAGDDVDVCWRLMDAGHRLGFAPAAIVWHHRRPSLKRYLKQQYGYGEAENQLEAKHPERFNLGGYIRWGGRVYAGAKRVSALFRPFVYHGRLGNGLFQTLYQKDPSYLLFGPAMIHWYFAWLLLLALSPLSVWLGAAGATMLAASLWVAVVQGLTSCPPVQLDRRQQWRKVWIVSLLHFLHPLVRWWGRVAPTLRRRRRQSTPEPCATVRERLREACRLGRGPKELRRFWGIGSAQREDLARAIHRQLKLDRASVSFGQDWSNHDLYVNGTWMAEGRIYSAPEHYDQALCVGFKGAMARPARLLLVLLATACIVLLLIDGRFAPALLLPMWLLWLVLGERARLRRQAWAAVDRVMGERGAVPYAGRK